MSGQHHLYMSQGARSILSRTPNQPPQPPIRRSLTSSLRRFFGCRYEHRAGRDLKGLSGSFGEILLLRHKGNRGLRRVGGMMMVKLHFGAELGCRDSRAKG